MRLRTELSRSCRGWMLSALAFGLMLSAPATAQCGTTGPTGSVSWTTQWCDEFNGAASSTIDRTKWTFDAGNSGFGNNELETYCDPSSNTAPCNSSAPNAFIDGKGHLAIQVRSPAVNSWTSARLKSQGLQEFHAGRIEASIQFPSATGLWPAFWLLGSQPGVDWPMVGESDIMENWPKTSKIPGPGAGGNCSTIHTLLTGGPGKGKCFTFPPGQQVDTAFHTYGQIWSANMIQYYLDDPANPFFVVTASDLPAGDTWPFSSPTDPFFIIMNIAVGGTLGSPTDANTGEQAPMLVDYVRQYLPTRIAPPKLKASGNISARAGATSGNTAAINVLGTARSGRVAFGCTTTAPKAGCVVTSNDSLNNHTVNFDKAKTARVAVTVTTTAGPNGTTPGAYKVTVNAYTVSSTDTAQPSASATLHLTVR